ncbi:hypothetical protein CAOG_003685 [Capsaspora owczarzaki ATCC 30864]|uniref:Transmembrane protein 135 N-terminal domain-containing protein n=2 Tax=Capsaspora owczarzaki (strain ATCC 30864) TaxID=595528 RepID=A0A0D2WNN1_CAPO3|nr:hypothetical protein CAOG_003685 [Capsaspora owczarzaki ATCC 30864]
MCFKAAGLRLYAPLFIIPALVRGKSIQHILTRTVPDVARSAFFIATFATSFCFYFCNFRHLLGFNTVLTNGIIPGFLASATSLPIEKKARRREIALYCSNHATSAVARLLVFHGWLPYVPYMDVATFTVAMSALMWTFRREPERLGSGVSALFGWMMDVRIPASPSDHPRSSQPAHNHQQPQQQGEQAQSSDRPSRPSRVKAILAKIQCPKPLLPTWRYIMGLLALKCPVCKHPGGCAHGALRAVLKGFALGFGLRGGVAFATSLAKYKLQLKKVLRAVFARPNLAFGGFLATLFGSARATECVLRLLRRKDDGINAVVAGAVSSLSILLARNEEISMYMLWKSFEALFNYGEARGMVPSWYHGDVLLFSVACSLLFHISVFEPHNLRRSYWNFLDKVSAGLWSHINRQAMDVLGFQSSALHPHDRV